MEEKDILRMLDETAAWQREADREHLEALGQKSTQGLRRWQRQRTLAWNVAASMAVLLVAGGWYTLLPQRVDDRQVLCNIPADKPLVVARACSALGNCGDRQVINMMNMK